MRKLKSDRARIATPVRSSYVQRCWRAKRCGRGVRALYRAPFLRVNPERAVGKLTTCPPLDGGCPITKIRYTSLTLQWARH